MRSQPRREFVRYSAFSGGHLGGGGEGGGDLSNILETMYFCSKTMEIRYII